MSDAWLACCFVSGILNIAFGLCVLAHETAAEVSSAAQESLMAAYLADERENAAETRWPPFKVSSAAQESLVAALLASGPIDVQPGPRRPSEVHPAVTTSAL